MGLLDPWHVFVFNAELDASLMVTNFKYLPFSSALISIMIQIDLTVIMFKEDMRARNPRRIELINKSLGAHC
jgi:hypothetical protein